MKNRPKRGEQLGEISASPLFTCENALVCARTNNTQTGVMIGSLVGAAALLLLLGLLAMRAARRRTAS